MNAMPTIALIGCGAMGGAIARGLVETGKVPGEGLLLVDASEERALGLARELGAKAAKAADLASAAAADAVVLAVKPQVLPGVARELASCKGSALVVSIAAGITLATLQGLFEGHHVVRVMPNLALTAGSGATAIAPAPSATPEEAAYVRDLFAAFGPAAIFTEAQLDAMGAISGCGPAYFALFVDALTRAAIEQGIPAAVAREFILATCRGTAAILSEGEHPRAFMEKVMSPGGTTAAAMAVMDPLFMEAASSGVEAAMERTRELAQKEA